VTVVDYCTGFDSGSPEHLRGWTSGYSDYYFDADLEVEEEAGY
jgi:hypothetical protein